MSIRMSRGALCSVGLVVALVVAGCERDRTLEQARREALGSQASPPTEEVPPWGHAQGQIELVQDRGRAAWAMVDLPEVPPPDPATTPDPATAGDPAQDQRASPFPQVEGLGDALAAVPLLLEQTPSAQLARGEVGDFVMTRGDLVLQLENRPEPSPAESASRAATSTPDRLRLTLDVGTGQPPVIRIEPVRTLGLTDEGAYTAWGPWPAIYAAWFIGNVVVDQRTVDQNHLMYLHAEPIPGTVSADGGEASPTYAVHILVLPVLIEGTVPQMQELAAGERLASAAAADEGEEEGTRKVATLPPSSRALHLVLLDAGREGGRTAALGTE